MQRQDRHFSAFHYNSGSLVAPSTLFVFARSSVILSLLEGEGRQTATTYCMQKTQLAFSGTILYYHYNVQSWHKVNSLHGVNKLRADF